MSDKRGRPVKVAPNMRLAIRTRIMVTLDFKRLVDNFLANFQSRTHLTQGELFRLAVEEMMEKYPTRSDASKCIAKAQKHFEKLAEGKPGKPSEQFVILLSPDLLERINAYQDATGIIENGTIINKFSKADLYRSAITVYVLKRTSTGRSAAAGQLGTLDASHVPVNGAIISDEGDDN